MRETITFKDYLKGLFVRYTAALILLMFVFFMLFMMLAFHLFIVKTNEESNRQVSRFIGEQYEAYQSGIEQLARQPALQLTLQGRGSLPETNRILYDFCLSHSIKGDFAVMDFDGKLVATNLYRTNQLLLMDNRTITDVLARLQREPDATYTGVIRIPFDNGQKADWLFARAVRASDGRPIGALLLSWQEESLGMFLRGKEADISVVTDAFNNVLFSTSNLAIDSMGKYDAAQSAETIIDNKPYYVTNDETTGGMKVFALTSVARQRQAMEFGVLFLFCISCFLLLLVLFLAEKVTNRGLGAVDELMHAVNECQRGNIDYQISSQTFAEFQTLYDEFNDMTVDFQELLKKNNALNERKRLMEVKHLEGQFNPHFAFNVLEALRYEIMIDPLQASKMVVAFANLMRYSINYGNSHVTLKTDIGYVRDYLLLQKMRYNQRLEYDIDIDEALLSCRVPKLLIQPIVENSIVHGLETAKNITIRMIIRAAGHDLILCVEDDGPGMSAEKLADLRHLLDNEAAMPEHIGLYNVHRAAQLLYGEDYGLVIESAPDAGMRVLLKIPVVLEDRDE